MRKLLSLIKRHRADRKYPFDSYIGKIVLDIECDGCMAHIHKLQRVGEITDVKSHKEIWPGSQQGPRVDRELYFVCRTIQRRDDSWPDNAPEELFYVPVNDSWLRPIPSGIGLFWRR